MDDLKKALHGAPEIMSIKIGVDIVRVSKFAEKFKKYRWKFERDVFWEKEMENDAAEHLAGIYAAKEAVAKALDLGAGKWKQIEVMYSDSGRPQCNIKGCDLSISHDGDYAYAAAIFYATLN